MNTEIQHYNATFDLPQNEAELEQVFKAFRMIYNEGMVQYQSGTMVTSCNMIHVIGDSLTQN